MNALIWFVLPLWSQIAPSVAISTPPAAIVALGETCEARVALTIAKGFHIQANPASEKWLIPAELKLKSSKEVRARAGRPEYPSGKPFQLKNGQKLATYKGTVEIHFPIEIKKSAKPGRHELSGTFRYQACDNQTCLFPETIPVKVPLEIIAMTQAHAKSKKLAPCAIASTLP